MPIIVIAHPDDELVGAYKLLTERKEAAAVILANASDDMRIAESVALCDYLSALDTEHPVDFFVNLEHFNTLSRNEAHGAYGDAVYLPSPTDTHKEHQAAMTVGLGSFGFGGVALWEYSIEKNAPYVSPLDGESIEKKRALFLRFFPSQVCELTDPKYTLFEGYAPFAPPDITVTFRQEGFHCWEDAPDSHAYLRDMHRHVFHVSLTLRSLKHHNRDLEFFAVQKIARHAFERIVMDGGSCESLARRLAIEMRVQYKLPVRVEVWEDGENGASVEV